MDKFEEFEEYFSRESFDYINLDQDERNAVHETLEAVMVYMVDRVLQKVVARDLEKPVVKTSDVHRYKNNLKQ